MKNILFYNRTILLSEKFSKSERNIEKPLPVSANHFLFSRLLSDAPNYDRTLIGPSAKVHGFGKTVNSRSSPARRSRFFANYQNAN